MNEVVLTGDIVNKFLESECFSSCEMPPDIGDWVDSNITSPYEWRLSAQMINQGFALVAIFEFEDPKDAILFKMTWFV